MKEVGMTLNILQEIEYQKSNYLCFKKIYNSKLNNINSQKNNNNKFRVKYSINKNQDIENNKNNYLNIKENFFKEDEENKIIEPSNLPVDIIPNLTPLYYHSLYKNKNNSIDINNFHLNNYKTAKNIKGRMRKNNFDINKVNKIRLERKEMINTKLRNIYTTDLEKILLNDNLNKAYQYIKYINNI